MSAIQFFDKLNILGSETIINYSRSAIAVTGGDDCDGDGDCGGDDCGDGIDCSGGWE